MLYLGMNKDRHNEWFPNVEGPFMQWIELYGSPIPVEVWAKYAAIDSDGKVYIFETEPLDLNTKKFKEWMVVAGGRVRCAGEVDLEGYNWRETLVELKCEKTYAAGLMQVI
uniref:Uncharacterized protein n=1 Tax=Klebsiella phage vB_Kpn2-P2 TaxID=3230849 RepID=A0AAU8EEG9_9VIRU